MYQNMASLGVEKLVQKEIFVKIQKIQEKLKKFEQLEKTKNNQRDKLTMIQIQINLRKSLKQLLKTEKNRLCKREDVSKQ